MFTKSFPKRFEGITKWIDVTLTEEEEREVEERARIENVRIFKECLEDARKIIDVGMKNFQSDVVNIARDLFEKRASHVIYWKEEKAKEKFNSQYSS